MRVSCEKSLRAAGNLHQSAASYLFPSGCKNILVERHKLFTDPAVQKDQIVRGGTDEGFKYHRSLDDFDCCRWGRNGAKPATGFDNKSGRHRKCLCLPVRRLSIAV